MAFRHANFEAIGTKWNLQVEGVVADASWQELITRLHDRIETFDAAYSRFRPDSLVTRIAKNAGSHPMPPDGLKLFNFYHRLYEATNGSVTPLIGQTMVEAGYDAAYSLQKRTMHRPPSWESALSYSSDTITTRQQVVLDFGAAGKGYLVDILGDMIEGAGVQTYIINAGGDIRYRSVTDEPLEVGLENPFDTSEAIGIAKLMNSSLCASSGSKRQWEGIHHIIDPASLQSPQHIIATWVLADDTMTADGLATGLFFTSPDKLLNQFSFSYAILHEDMSLHASKEFPVTIFEAH